MKRTTRTTAPTAAASEKLLNLVKDDASPPVIYRTAPDGTRFRCVWNPSIQDYDCTELHADGFPVVQP